MGVERSHTKLLVLCSPLLGIWTEQRSVVPRGRKGQPGLVNFLDGARATASHCRFKRAGRQRNANNIHSGVEDFDGDGWDSWGSDAAGTLGRRSALWGRRPAPWWVGAEPTGGPLPCRGEPGRACWDLLAMDGERLPGGPMLRGRSGGEVLYGDGVLPLGGWGLNLRVVHFRAEGSRGGLAGT